MNNYHRPTTRFGEGGTCDDAGGLEQPDRTVELLADIMKGITSDMDWSLLENAICVLALAKEEEMNESDRAAIQCALIKAYLIRFCCLGWVEDDETVEHLLAEDGVPTELMVARWANPWIWDNPESVEFALELISSLRQSIDGGRLETAICVGCTTLESGEPKGNDDCGILTMLGKALVMQYIHGGLLADLNEGGARLRDVAQRTGLGGPWVYICALSLKNVAWLRVTETRNIEALRELEEWRAVAKKEEKEGRDSFIHGTDMLERGELDSSIRLLSVSLFCQAAPHPRRAATINNLASALWTRFEQKGDLGDLGECIRLHRESLDLFPAPHPLRSLSLNNLANALVTRFEQKSDFGDLEECIRFHRESLNLRADPHPDRSSPLSNLASALGTRFGNKGDFEDLEECIRLNRESLDLRAAPHPDRSTSLNNLANALSNRFQEKGNFGDLEECICLHRESLDLFPDPHPHRSGSLNNLANALFTRFQQKGNFGDLEECIRLHREYLDLFLSPHPDRSTSLNNLASALGTRFGHKGDFEDLEECIRLNRESLDLFPDPHPHRSGSLNNLANALFTRFQQKGNFGDLEECIRLHRESLDLFLAPHPDRSTSLNNLANALSNRFQQKGIFRDLEECICLHRESLDLFPEPHPHRSGSLNNLAHALSSRFEQKGNFGDLEECIRLNRESLDLRAAPHPHRSGSLNNLANALSNRFQKKGKFRDLEECIRLHRESLDLCPAPHPHRSGSLNNLANALSTRFQQKGNFGDLEECIRLHRESLDLFPAPLPDRSSCLNNLAIDFRLHYLHTKEHTYLDKALKLYEAASKYPTGSLLDRLRYSQTWASRSRTHYPQSALLAYDYAISLLPLLSSIDLTLSQRQSVLVHVKAIVSDAVQCAIQAGKLNDAVVFLSTARSVFWSQALQLRSPLDRLESADPTLAQELRKVSRRLEQAAHQDSGNGFPTHTVKHGAQEDLQSLAKKREELIEKARKLDGFEDFLRPPSFDSISRAAINGHIIFLNASEYGCDAVVLCPGGLVQHISLSTVDLPRVQKLNKAIRKLSQGRSVRSEVTIAIEGLFERRIERTGKRTIDDHFEYLLRVLWTAVVKPIIERLKLTKNDIPSRVWWCPTGPFSFLPIHAAGIYSEKGVSECLSDYAVSSYCYTPQDLLSPPPEPTPNFSFLAVVEPIGKPGWASLPATEVELEKIRGLIPSTATLIEHIGLEDHPTNRDAILDDIRRCSIAHFGCHGFQHPSNPLESKLALSGGDLTMGRMIRDCQTSNAALAYLSACQSAKTDKERPDEALTLAATMMFAGFRGVVGTMWSIQDQDAPIVAEAFYQYLFRHGTERPPVATDAAYALHLAVKKFRDEGRPFWNWVPFVHFGI